MNIRKKEIYRYLGYGGKTPDERICSYIDEVIEEIQSGLKCSNIMTLFSCKVKEGQVYLKNEYADFCLESKNLSQNLFSCDYAILMAATLGNYPDLLIKKYEVANIAKAAMVQAASAEMIEAYCNEIQEKIKDEWQKKGYFLRPRFSPGYGDLNISEQKRFFELLSCEKRIGLTLTDSCLMLPTKSVTALIGLTRDSKNCHISKCKNCEKKDCEFRNEDN